MSETLQTPRRTTAPIVLAVASLFVLLATIGVALRSSLGQRWDQIAMESVYAGPETRETLLSYLSYISIGTIAVALVACMALALAQGRIRSAVAAAAIIAGSNLTTQVLKHSILERPDFGFTTLNSLPSGHTTVAASVVLAALLVAPVTLRPLFAVAGSFAVTLVGTSTIAGGWHRPGDIVAALAVCLLWASVIAAAVGVGTLDESGLPVTVFSLVGAGAAGVFLIVVGVRPTYGWGGLIDSALVLGVIGVITAATVATFARLTPQR